MAILCPFYVPPQKSNSWEEVGIGVWCLLMYKKGHAVVRCPGLLFVNGDRKGHKWPFYGKSPIAGKKWALVCGACECTKRVMRS